MKNKLSILSIGLILLITSCTPDLTTSTNPTSSAVSDSSSTSQQTSESTNETTSSDSTSSGETTSGSTTSQLPKEIDLINSTFTTSTITSNNEYVTTLRIEDKTNHNFIEKTYKDPLSNPYLDIDTDAEKEYFYTNNYTQAQTSIDAKYRSEAGLLSGDPAEEKFMPDDFKKIDNSKVNMERSTTFNYYVDSETNENTAYLLYRLDGTYTPIFNGGAYFTLNQLAAYTVGFGALPPNQDYDKYEAMQDISSEKWYKYGRVNRGFYDGPVKDKYAYETWFVGMEKKDINYTETDFGNSVYYNDNEYDPQYKQMPYVKNIDGKYKINSGTPGDRGVLRLCFTSAFENIMPKPHKAAHGTDDTNNNFQNQYYKRAYYTFNHYNDWSEFLNYEDGWTDIYGNMTRGNKYCEMNVHTDKQYAPIPTDLELKQIIEHYKQ